jgi:hypothetical protein
MILEVTIHNVESLLKLGEIKIALVYPITKESHFKLLHDIKIILSDKRELIIPAGFTFNGSSSPRGIWWLFPSYGDFAFAATLHDYLYGIKFLRSQVGTYIAQKYADDEMLIWSNIINRKNRLKLIDNYLRYKAVRWFGKKQYLD